MIGIEIWETSGNSLREGWSAWIDRALESALETTNGDVWAAGIETARAEGGARRELPYSPAEWNRQKAAFAQGELRELVMGLNGGGWQLEVTADNRERSPSKPLWVHVGLFLHRDTPNAVEDPLLDRVDLLEQGAQLGATGGRIGPTQTGLTWWENLTGRHHYDFWSVADHCIRGPDFAVLLGPGHIRALGGLEKVQKDCPCEKIVPVKGTDLILLQLVEKVVIDKELEGKASQLEEYLAPLLDW